MMTIVVGEGGEAREFMVYKSYVTKSSKFFKAAMTQDWKEAREKRITIPDHDPAAFEGYLNWVYSKQITLKGDKQLCDHCIEDKVDEAGCLSTQSMELTNMYIIGDYLDDKRFCNAVMDDLKDLAIQSACTPSPQTVCHVWECTSPSSPLRKLFLQDMASMIYTDENGSWLKDEETPKDFVVDLLVFVGQRSEKFLGKVWQDDLNRLEEKCSFHLHVDDSDKCS